MNKYICEFIGTFFLLLTVGTTVIHGDSGVIPALAIGLMLTAMVFATGHISGAHLNPAITLALWIRGKCSAADVPGYMIGQTLGALAASFLVLFMKGHPAVTPMQFPDGPLIPFLAEFLGTFALGFVVLNVATAKANASNSFYGVAIGFTIVGAAFSLGGYSGGAFNPAVAIGITAMGLNAVANIWIHLVADFLGGIAAALVFRAVSPEDVQRMVVAPQDVPPPR